jgi:aspartate/methionine/tyrosine aminotransferase
MQASRPIAADCLVPVCMHSPTHFPDSSGPDADRSEPLYGVTDFAAWMRGLYRRMPLASEARSLFESTIEEPVALLAEASRVVFDAEDQGYFQSVFGRGNARLIQAVARRYGVAADQVLTTTGAGNGVAQALRSVIQPGDRVLIETPGFSVLDEIVRASGAAVDHLPRAADAFAVSPAEVRAAIQPGTRAVVLSNLHNPSGCWLDDREILDIARLLARDGIWLILDEVYADFARQPGGRVAVAPNLVRVNSLTKVFGLFSLRCGWLIAEPSVVAAVTLANEAVEHGASKLTHAVGAVVLERPEAFEAHWRAVLQINRPVLLRHVQAMQADGLIAGGVPEYGCIYFPRIVGFDDTLALAERLWRRSGLITAPGEFFGAPGHMRLGFGGDAAALDEGLARLHRALKLECEARNGSSAGSYPGD